jgi:predicted small metal-binding protein
METKVIYEGEQVGIERHLGKYAVAPYWFYCCLKPDDARWDVEADTRKEVLKSINDALKFYHGVITELEEAKAKFQEGQGDSATGEK